jgi:hypothetical protein
MMNKRLKYSAVLSIVFLSTIYAEGIGGLAGSFLKMGTSARGIAMGNALTAEWGPEPVTYYNPAGIGSVNRLSFKATNQFLVLDRKHSVIGLAVKVPPAAGVGILWIHAGVDDIDGRDTDGRHTEKYSANEDAIFISFAQKFAEKISVGLTLKILQQQLPTGANMLQGSGIGFDFGLLYLLNQELSFGLVAKNIKTGYQWSNKTYASQEHVYEDRFPTTVLTGASYYWKSWQFVGDLGFNIFENEIVDSELRLGVEYLYNKNLFIRAGFQDTNPSLGLGFKHSLFGEDDSSINYAIVIENVTFPTHVISYALRL